MCRKKDDKSLFARPKTEQTGDYWRLPKNVFWKHIEVIYKGKGSGRNAKDLPHQVELAVGMRVMVANNVETDLDITNGAQGEIVDIILHPDEPSFNANRSKVVLRRTWSLSSQRLPHIELERRLKMGRPSSGPFDAPSFQWPPATTDYRAQGQTIFFVIVDIASPPTGTLNLFNLYVALSRSSGRDTIRLLRAFDWNIFKRSHDDELLREDERPEAMDAATEVWYKRVVQVQEWMWSYYTYKRPDANQAYDVVWRNCIIGAENASFGLRNGVRFKLWQFFHV